MATASISQTINQSLVSWRIGGVAIASVLGLAISISYIMSNRLQSKYYTARLRQLEDEGYYTPASLDKFFQQIEAQVGLSAQESDAEAALTASKEAKAKKSATPENVSFDGSVEDAFAALETMGKVKDDWN